MNHLQAALSKYLCHSELVHLQVETETRLEQKHLSWLEYYSSVHCFYLNLVDDFKYRTSYTLLWKDVTYIF